MAFCMCVGKNSARLSQREFNRDSGISGTDKGFVHVGPNSCSPSLIRIVEFVEKKLTGVESRCFEPTRKNWFEKLEIELQCSTVGLVEIK